MSEEPLPGAQLLSPHVIAHLEANHGREMDFSDLAPSLDAYGITFHIMVCTHPDPASPFEYLCLDGNRRLAWAKVRNKMVPAFVIDHPVTRIEALRILHTSDLKKKLTLQEIANDAAMLLDEGMSQCQIARHLDRSEATISRALCLSLMPEEERERLLGLGVTYSAIAMIAPLTGELKSKAIAFATAPGPDGKLPVRDALSLFIAEQKKGGKPKGPKPQTVTATVNARTITFRIHPGETSDQVIKDLKALIKRLGMWGDEPPHILK